MHDESVHAELLAFLEARQHEVVNVMSVSERQQCVLERERLFKSMRPPSPKIYMEVQHSKAYT
jgi:hypothetical protein